jgi:geranylgeranyl pyrophosphate synthase
MWAGAGREVLRMLNRMGDLLGLAYQLQNDLSVLITEPSTNEPHCDLDAGKRTWVLWKAYQLLDDSGRRELLAALKAPAGARRRIRIWRSIQRSGAIEQSQIRVNAWREEAFGLLRESCLTTPQRKDYAQIFANLTSRNPQSVCGEENQTRCEP